MDRKIERPKVTRELIMKAAVTFCQKHGYSNKQAEDLGRKARPNMDGYELAKLLENVCGWNPKAVDVEILDCFDNEIRNAHRDECWKWVGDNDIKPPFPIGTMTTLGRILRVYEHEPASYVVESESGIRLIITFEEALVPIRGKPKEKTE